MTDIPESEMRLIRNQAVRYAVDLVTSPQMRFTLSSTGIVKMAEFYAQYIATGKIPEPRTNDGEEAQTSDG